MPTNVCEFAGRFLLAGRVVPHSLSLASFGSSLGEGAKGGCGFAGGGMSGVLFPAGGIAISPASLVLPIFLSAHTKNLHIFQKIPSFSVATLKKRCYNSIKRICISKQYTKRPFLQITFAKGVLT